MDNYFTLLNMPESFALNLAALEKTYFDLQRQHHPDRAVGKSEKERADAVMLAMRLNDAYDTLKNPLSRAEYMLGLHGIFIDDSTRPQPSLLMEIMELREQMQEAAKNKTALMPLINDTKKAMQQCTDGLEEAFDVADYDYARTLTLRLNYLGKALEEALMLLYHARAAYEAEHEKHVH